MLKQFCCQKALRSCRIEMNRQSRSHPHIIVPLSKPLQHASPPLNNKMIAKNTKMSTLRAKNGMEAV